MYWDIRYLESVESWLEKLSKEQVKAVAKELKLLELSGNQLRLPHSRSLGHGLFELRERKYGFRLYYTFGKDKSVWLIHAGDKDSQEKDILKAKMKLEALEWGSL